MGEIFFMYEKHINNKEFHYLRRLFDSSDIDLHTHDYYEMFMLLEGNVNYTVEGNTYTMKPYDLVFTNPRELHMPIYGGGVYEIVFISFKRLFLENAISEEYDPYKPFEQHKLGTNNKIDASLVKKYGIDKMFREIEEILKEDGEEMTLAIRAKLILFLIAINKVSQSTPESYKTNKTVEAIIAYINENLEKDLRSEELGKVFFLDRNYLRNLFKNYTGYSVSEYVMNKRILKAQHLIRQGVNAHEAAERVGYGDYSTFFRAYKRITGEAPSKTKK